MICLKLRRFFSTNRWNSYKEIELQKWEYEANFMRSSGPGGQSVNTTNSKAQLRLKLNSCVAIDSHTLSNLRLKYGNHISKTDELIVRSQTHKSQAKNLDDCFERIQKMIFECSIVHEPRSQEPFEEPIQIREKRLESKKKRSAIKSTRQGKNLDY